MGEGFAVPGIDFVGSQANTQPVSTITQLDDDDDVVVVCYCFFSILLWTLNFWNDYIEWLVNIILFSLV